MSIIEKAPAAILLASPARNGVDHGAHAGTERHRGRPLLVPREAVLEAIRQLAVRGDGLFRIHRQHPDLYARARRMFGSWSRAVAMAGLDYRGAIEAARQRSLQSRRSRTKRIANRAS